MPAEATCFIAGFARDGTKADAALLGTISASHRKRVAADPLSPPISNDSRRQGLLLSAQKRRHPLDPNAATITGRQWQLRQRYGLLPAFEGQP
ncbi:hypothetical protein AB4037_33775 [Labrys sp. KB_33_2]|uniref:hypothetical protein n=1 Tax=Labrys sp. KB_33_2 TaxID=3237479 RepID=UPI003F908704